MARRRDFKAEAARRNELARSRGGYTSSYRVRVEKARKEYPGISTAAARGHGTPDEKEAMRLNRLIPKLNPDTMIAFTGTNRQPDGTWVVGRFDVLTDDRGDLNFKIGPSAHYMLPTIATTISNAGWANLGAKYLSMMADNNIRLRESSPVSNPRGPVFADGEHVGEGVDEQGKRANLERSLSKWRRRR